MAEETVYVKVVSSWQTANQKALRDAVTIVPLSVAKREEEGSLTDMVELDSCVLLSHPGEENGNDDAACIPCSITFKLESPPTAVISNVVVICEARMIEVYGTHNEYLTTVPAELLDEVEDTAIYCADIKLNQLTQECTLKFARKSRTSDMWLYGVKLIWNTEDRFEINISQKSGLNYEKVEQRLKGSDTQLSNRAENCKQFLKMYSTLSDKKKALEGLPSLPDQLSLLSLLPMMGGQRKVSHQEGINLHSMAQGFQNITGASSSGPVSSEIHPLGESEKSMCQRCSQKLESILERQLLSMENRIMKALDEKVNAMQQYQNTQIQNLFHLLAGNKDFHGERLKHEEKKANSMNPTLSDQDFKLEQAVKKFMDQKRVHMFSRQSDRKSSASEENEDILRNAFMKLNEFYAGTSRQSMIESTGSSVAQNGM